MISFEKKFGKLTFVTISDIGSNHQALLIPNQDAVNFLCIDDDFVLTLSDGVGSCKKAEIGSKNAVLSSIEVFKKIKSRHIKYENDLIRESLLSTWKALIKEDNINDFCATLKAVFKIGNLIKVVSVGDGFITISSDGISLITPTEQGEFTNETKCLGSHITENDLWMADFHLDTRKSFAIMCCTDGVANALLPGKEIDLIEDIEKNVLSKNLKNELEELINDISNYSFDDRTLGVVKYEW